MRSSCDRDREAISARLAGEGPGVPEARIEPHLDTCAGCRTWASAADGLSGRLTSGGEPALPTAALADLLDHAAPAHRRRRPLGEWRSALGLVAAAQPVLVWPGVVLDDGHAPAHAANELTSWDLGLAVGPRLLAGCRRGRGAPCSSPASAACG